MINYTERITSLMRDIIARVPRLSHVDASELLVFARHGRSGAEGAFATCHCIGMPPTDPGYYYWSDRLTGALTRRSHWFVTKSPDVTVEGRHIRYLISFALPRFCDQTLRGAPKERFYTKAPGWLAKLDTIVHELYHIDPRSAGIRSVERHDGAPSSRSHGDDFLSDVADMVRQYIQSQPDPDAYGFLRHGFAELESRHGGVVATTFRSFPSFPQRYIELVPPSERPDTAPAVPIHPVKAWAGRTHFTEDDLMSRQFLDRATRGSAGTR